MKITLVLLLTFLATSSYGQIKNIEDARIAADSNGWYGSISESFKAWKTKKENLAFYTDLNLAFRTGKHLFLDVASGAYVKYGENVALQRVFNHVRYNYLHTKVFSEEIFYQVNYDRILDVAVRHLIGMGGRFILKEDVNVGVAVMNEHEELVEGTINNDWRISAYAAWNATIGEHTQLRHVTYYQPVITKCNDLRLSSTLMLEIDISEKLSLSAGVSILYDTYQAPGIDEFLYETSQGITYKLR